MNKSIIITIVAAFATIMATSHLNAAVVNITSGSTSGYTMTDGNTYVVKNSVSFSNSTAGGSGMTVAANATVVLYVPAGITLTATGGSCGAGICVPETATLIITGEGIVNATGGNATNGRNGGRGGDGSAWINSEYDHHAIAGSGGSGGSGGRGAGAGIGGAHATTMGTCYAIGFITISAKGGSQASSGSTGSGGSYASAEYLVPRGFLIYSYASGGGGGGGGCGGFAPYYAIRGGGADGNDGENGHSGYALSGTNEKQNGTLYKTPGPSGKTGTSRNNTGGDGTLYVASTASVNVNRTKLSATTHTAAQYVVSFYANGGIFTNSARSVTATLGCEMPDCIPAPTKDGCTFVGWAPDKAGTLMWYDQDGTKNLSTYTNPSNTTLYAVWKTSPTWYVDAATGDDLHSGLSWDCAKKTIQSAIDCACDGDTILVKPGIYVERSHITGGLSNSDGINVTIRSMEGPGATILDGENARRVVKGTAVATQDDWVNHVLTVDGFTIQNGYYTGTSAAAYCNLINCIIKDNFAARSTIASNAHFENCLIVGNIVSNSLQSSEATLLDKLSIVCCTISDNILLNGNGCIAFPKCDIKNSIICGNDCGSGDMFSTNSIVANSCSDYEAAGEKNIVASANAVFIDAANGNYRLREDSPCIDAGDSSYSSLAVDLDGNQRILGRNIDMGAFEFHDFPKRPAITPANGTILEGITNVTIACDTAGVTIHYTTDGSEPTEESPVYRRFRISGRTLVKAVAIKNGLCSETAVAEYALGQCANPVITPVDGSTFNWSGETVSINWQGEDGVLRYTIDGTDPTAESPIYGGPFTIDETTVVKVKAFGDQFFDSTIVTASLTRVWVNVATPAVTAAASFTGSKTQVALSCATEGATIRYTLNGNDPNSHSTRYTSPFYVTNSCTVKAYAVCADYLNSAVASFAIEKVWGIGDTLGAPDRAFTTDGNLPFIRVIDATAPLGESMRSGAITHNQTSTLSTTVSGPGTVSFQWKASCEEDPLYEWDHVEFLVDGDIVARLCGETAWQTVSHPVSGDGEHTLLWRYVKDDVESEGEDCCWVADFNWTPSGPAETQTTPDPVPYAYFDTDYPALLAAHGGDYEEAANATAANGVNKVWECYVAGLCPTNAAAKFEARIEIGADGQPIISWEPDLNEDGTKHERVYTVEGRESLTQGLWGPTNANSRFFRVKVELK